MGRTGRRRRTKRDGRQRAAAVTAGASETREPGFPLLRIAAVAALLAVTAAVYQPVADFSFIRMDDELYVYGNQHVQGGLSAESLRWSVSGIAAGHWHPLTVLSLMFDFHRAGLSPRAFHLTNLCLHLAGITVLIAAFTRLTGCFWRSLFVGSVFALHPTHVESVAWISERKDVLSGLLFGVTLLAYANYVRRPRLGAYLLVVLAFICGLLSKAILVSLPLVLLLCDYWPLRRFKLCESAAETWRCVRRLVWEKVPLLGLSCLSCVVTVLAAHSTGAVSSLGALSIETRFANILSGYVAYLGTLVWPLRLSPFYPYRYLHFSSWQPWAAGLLLAGVTYFVFCLRRSQPYLLMGWLWFLIVLFPVSGLVQSGGLARADRYTYIPYVGLAIIVAWGAPLLVKRFLPAAPRSVLWAAGFLAVLSMAGLSRAYLPVWRDDVTFWKRIIEVKPDYADGYFNLGLAYTARKDPASAEQQYRLALQVNPVCPNANNNLGNILRERGEVEQALGHYRAEINLNPESPMPYNNLGAGLAQQGDLNQALKNYLTALDIWPDYPDALFNLAHALVKTGDVDGAVLRYRQLLKVSPDRYDAYIELANILDGRGGYPEAERLLREAIRLDPRNPVALNNLGSVFLHQDRSEEAVSYYRQALQLAPDHAVAKANLATALKALGRS